MITLIKTTNKISHTQTTQEQIADLTVDQVKSKVGKEFNAKPELLFVQVIDTSGSVLILQKDLQGKCIQRFSA